MLLLCVPRHTRGVLETLTDISTQDFGMLLFNLIHFGCNPGVRPSLGRARLQVAHGPASQAPPAHGPQQPWWLPATAGSAAGLFFPKPTPSGKHV